MMKILCGILLVFCVCGCSPDKNKKMYVTKNKDTRNTQTNYPYLSGDVFRSISDHIVDNTHIPFFPDKVKEKDIIFVKTKYLDRFVKYMHPYIKHPYVLITHNGDEEIPGPFEHLLKDPKIIVWFGMNATLDHPKLKPLPIGFGNTHEATFHITDRNIFELQSSPLRKEKLLYLNFEAQTHPERVTVREFFSSKPFCTIEPRKSFGDYIADVMRSKFVVSPRGAGIDCCRVWESLIVGTIPIVKSSPLDALYAELPILIVNDWSDVTEAFLEEKYEEMCAKEYCLEKMYSDYWIEQITAYANKSIPHDERVKRSRFGQEPVPVYIKYHGEIGEASIEKNIQKDPSLI